MSWRYYRPYFVVGGLLALSILAFVLTSCGSGPAPEVDQGDPATHALLRATTSCEALQSAFDRADDYRSQALADEDVDQAEISLSYMRTAGARMVELQCTSQTTQGASTP